MINHLENLEKFIAESDIYNHYLEKDDNKYTYYELICINHVKDIVWAVDELKALYELVKEMRNENIKTRKNEN